MGIFKKNSAESQPTASIGPDEFAFLWQEAWNSRVAAMVTDLCAADVRWSDPLTQSPEAGREAVRTYLEQVWATFPDLSFTYPEQPYTAESGSRLALHWHCTGTMRGSLEPGYAPTRKYFEAHGVDLLHLDEDGLVKWYLGLFDRQSAAQQLGILPGAGSRGEATAIRIQRVLAKLK